MGVYTPSAGGTQADHCEEQLYSSIMKLIAVCLLICFATETVHCSRQWHLWDYLKELVSGDRGPVMPVQVS